MNFYIVGINQIYDIEIDKVILWSYDKLVLHYAFIHGNILYNTILSEGYDL